MLTFLLVVIFLIVAALIWLQGFWNSVVTFINFMFAVMLALNFYEPLAAALSDSSPNYAYVWDVVVFWILFAFGFGILRLFTDLLSRSRVQFHIGVEMAGRSIMALWIAWMFVGLVCLSLHIGPLPAAPFGTFQQSPDDSTFMGFSPGRQWFAFMQSRSRGALSSTSGESPYPQDEGMNVFDPRSEYIIKYHQRRVDFESQ